MTTMHHQHFRMVEPAPSEANIKLAVKTKTIKKKINNLAAEGERRGREKKIHYNRHQQQG